MDGHVWFSCINPLYAKLSYVNFHSQLCLYREPQLQVAENYLIWDQTFANIDF